MISMHTYGRRRRGTKRRQRGETNKSADATSNTNNNLQSTSAADAIDVVARLESFFYGEVRAAASMMPTTSESRRYSSLISKESVTSAGGSSDTDTVVPPSTNATFWEAPSPTSIIIPLVTSRHVFSEDDNGCPPSNILDTRDDLDGCVSPNSRHDDGVPAPIMLSRRARTQSLPDLHPATSSSESPRPVKSALKRTGIANRSELNHSSSSGSIRDGRSVSFTHVQFREYGVCLSDHPSCSWGPPIQLGWDYEERESLPLEDYEECRSPQRRTARHQLILSYNTRRRLLLKQAGYTNMDLKKAVDEVDRVKRERMMTELWLKASFIDETVEHVRTFFSKCII